MPKTPVEELNIDTVGSSIFGNGIPPKVESPQDEIMKEILREVFSVENIEVKTDLKDSQILAFTQAELFADAYQVPLLKTAVDRLSIRLISKNRLGRKEFTEIAKSLRSSAEALNTPTLGGRLFGKE